MTVLDTGDPWHTGDEPDQTGRLCGLCTTRDAAPGRGCCLPCWLDIRHELTPLRMALAR